MGMLSWGRKKEVRQDTITAGSWVVRRIRYGTPLDSHLVVIVVFSGPLIVGYIFTRFWPLLILAYSLVFRFTPFIRTLGITEITTPKN